MPTSMVYGCDLAAGAQGQALLQGLQQLTGADVAASIDATGARERSAATGTSNTPPVPSRS